LRHLGLSLLSPVIIILRDDFLASADLAQLVLSAFMVSVAISQLISRSLSDWFGRKKILLSGSVIFIVGGIGTLLSTTIDMLIGFRILQGAGAAACMTMGRLIVNDVYQGAEAARKLSVVSSAQAIAPAIGFAFGGVIAECIGWRGSIGIMAMGGLLIAVMSYLFIDESRRGDPVLFRPAPLINAYLALLKTSGVMFHGLINGLAVGMFLSWRLQRACHCECDDLQHARRWRQQRCWYGPFGGNANAVWRGRGKRNHCAWRRRLF